MSCRLLVRWVAWSLQRNFDSRRPDIWELSIYALVFFSLYLSTFGRRWVIAASMSLRSGRVRAAPAATFAPAVDAEPSAAQRLWSISEIKLRILEFLCTGDLLRVLRTHKKGMSDVSKVLYREVTVGRADSSQTSTLPPRSASHR